jgi:benzoyl-CoA reductase/2-hydroxyglutaryl-CoA dehydratase subunit BcrC/BadD/HgdB
VAELERIVDDIISEPTGDTVVEAVRRRGHGIGYTCSFVPEPLLSVRGLVPVRLRVPDISGTPMADTYLSSVLCPYVRSLLEVALDDLLPQVDGWVLTVSCDAMRRLHDNLTYLIDPPFVRILDVPHKTGEAAVAWFERELLELSRALSTHFEVDLGDDALRESIDRTNEFRALMRSLSELRKRVPSPITGTEFHRIIVAASSAPKECLSGLLRDFVAEREGAIVDAMPRARVLLVGSQLDEPRFVQVIESCGAQVVADRFCNGALPGLEPIEHHERPLHALAFHTMKKTACPRMMDDFPQRLADILQLARDFRVDGIVVETMKFCDLWGVESAALVRCLRDAGIPVLRLEREYADGGEGQVRTRVQAFLESMDR